MIIKVIKGAGFRGTVNYCHEKNGSRQIGGNMAGRNPRELAREFGAVRSQNQSCQRPVAHFPLSAAPGETLTDEQWHDAARDHLRHMGMDPDEHQYVVYRHSDKKHDHIHVVANRINSKTLQVANDSRDFKRAHESSRILEQKFGLQIAKKKERALTPAAKGPAANGMRQRIDQAIKDCRGDRDLFIGHLRRTGIEPTFNRQKTGRIAGAKFQDVASGTTFKGSDLGKGYGWKALDRRLTKQADFVKQAAANRPGFTNALAGNVACKVLGHLPGGRLIKAAQKLSDLADASQKAGKAAGEARRNGLEL